MLAPRSDDAQYNKFKDMQKSGVAAGEDGKGGWDGNQAPDIEDKTKKEDKPKK